MYLRIVFSFNIISHSFGLIPSFCSSSFTLALSLFYITWGFIIMMFWNIILNFFSPRFFFIQSFYIFKFRQFIKENYLKWILLFFHNVNRVIFNEIFQRFSFNFFQFLLRSLGFSLFLVCGCNLFLRILNQFLWQVQRNPIYNETTFENGI